MRFNPGTDVAFLNGLMHVIIREELYDAEFIEERTEAFDRLRDTVQRLHAAHGVAPDRGWRSRN